MDKTITLDGKQYSILGMSESPHGIFMSIKGHDFFVPDKSQPHIVQFSHWKEPVKLLIKVDCYANDFFELKTFVTALVVE